MAATGTVWEASRPEIPVSMATEYVCTRYQLHFTLISYCLKKKIGIGSRQIYRYFILMVKITFPFTWIQVVNLFDHKLPSLRTLYMRYFKWWSFFYSVLKFLKQKHWHYVFCFPQFPAQKKTSTFIPFWKNRQTYRPTMWTISLMC